MYPIGLSLNLSSLISIYSTMLRALLFFILSEIISEEKWHWLDHSRRLRHLDDFDLASRGSWGSVKLLTTSYKANFPSVAAVSMVILLAVGPFTQQAIQTTTCHRRLPGEALVPIANKITKDSDVIYSNNVSIVFQARSHQALLSGITGRENMKQTSTLPFTCRTGNCTFPVLQNITYASVGICHECEDITNSIEETYGNFGSDYTYTIKDPAGNPIQVSPMGRSQLHVISLASESHREFNTKILIRSLNKCVDDLGKHECKPWERNQHLRFKGLDSALRIIGARCRLY
ncbi:hypothetical protein QBC38DRAFT_176076 [Podospora fimiseda]|uniref:Uncharacterized protein n=1 Tax=Podospora fimiseda TaxID=252190 RepID=A0AAN7BGA8_9PEZI|nr:hypothetical protein QBC38DRAFT_176076 [Podospora fimiseda]